MPNYAADFRSCDLDGSINILGTYQAECQRFSFRCDISKCPRCGVSRKDDSSFRRHALRLRFLLVTVDRLVYRVAVRLARWQCSGCRQTFTNYPPFMFRYKHYALPEMSARARTYVLDEKLSYRRGVTESNLPIFHRNSDLCDSGSTNRQRELEVMVVLSHATLFRWVTSLGSLKVQGGSAPRRPVYPRKYHTKTRMGILQACLASEPGV